MTLYDIHNALARSLGDPFKETVAKTIYDGVRFSSIARQGYLYRAACSIINEIVTQVAPTPYEVSAEILSRILPSMLSQISTQNVIGTSGSFVFNVNDPVTNTNPEKYVAFIVSAYLQYGDDIIPVPLVSPLRGRKIASSASRAQNGDCVAWIKHATNNTITPNGSWSVVFFPTVNFDFSGYYANIEFIRYPLNQDLSDPTANFDFEESFIDTIIKKAALYGMVDDGDLSARELLPYIAGGK